MKKQKKVDWKIIITAIASLTIIECFAMSHGINGTFRAIVTGIIAGLAGFKLNKLNRS